MTNQKQTIGIIGTGSFGSFLADKLAPHFQFKLVGRKSSEADFVAAVKSDYLVLAVPFDAYGGILERIKSDLRAKTVLVDICSVKELPIQLIRAELPDQPLLATHPLFGPQSAANSLVGHDMIICPQPGNEALEAKATKFFTDLGLKVSQMSATEHDMLMADLHGLTFFVARALALYGVDEQTICTPSYKRLLELANLEKHHSPELFATIQLANPQVREVREKFMAIMEALNKSLDVT